jgi:hypothetical protein
MTTALEERVDRLEERVEQLETWAGPGQNEGFSANLVEIRKSLAALTGMLIEQSQTLSKHGATLDNHTGILDNHTGILNNHTGILNNHTGILNEILLRLPPRPEQPGEQSLRMR